MMDITALIVAMISLIFVLFTYIKHDLELKKQANLINKYQIEKIEIEKEEEKKAIIEANIIKGKGKIKIYNKGKSIARNVTVVIPNIDGFTIINNPCPIDIKPQNGAEISYITSLGCRLDKIDINYYWSDDFCDSNNDEQTIQI